MATSDEITRDILVALLAKITPDGKNSKEMAANAGEMYKAILSAVRPPSGVVSATVQDLRPSKQF